MEFDPVLLSRLQFAFVIAFHILLPAFTVGLSAFIAVLEGRYLFRKDPVHLRLSLFWTKIFAVAFGMGVVSGIVMPFQFGTNWSRYADATANVLGPLFTYEVMAAFFLESGFLGILLFGRKLVPPWAHFLSAVMVAAGTLLSSFWILAANSWMQTPAGYAIENGVAVPTDWLKVIFNPSFPYRFAHMLNAAYLTTGFVVLAVGARYLIGGKYIEEGRTMLRMAIGLMAILAPLQLIIGDQHGLNGNRVQLMHQGSPVKMDAAAEYPEQQRGDDDKDDREKPSQARRGWFGQGFGGLLGAGWHGERGSGWASWSAERPCPSCSAMCAP